MKEIDALISLLAGTMSIGKGASFIFMERNDLYQKYIIENLSRKDCALFFGVSETTIKRKAKEYNIVKSQFQKSELMSSKQKIHLKREELENLYIEQNLTLKECADVLKVSSNIVKKRLRDFDIKKPSYKFKKVHKTHSNQTENSLKKRKETLIKKYGVDNISKVKNIKKQKEITTRQHYGVVNPFQAKKIKKKIVANNLKKYGVPYSCMRQECRKYSGNNSKPNQEFASLLEKDNIEFEREFSIDNYSYDFKVKNMLFEINPTIFHNSTMSPVGKCKERNYHANKSKVAKEFGYHCIHVFDWDNMEKIVKVFLIDKEKVYARKCEIKGVTVEEAKIFLNENHLQGYAKDQIRIGLYYNDKLVELMTFDKPRYNKNYEWELIRLCSNKNVIGGTEKLFKYFLDTYKPKSIISYCDLSKFDGSVYERLGFKVKNKPQPSKHWISLKTGEHITDNLLRQKGFDQLFKKNYGKGTNNEKLMLENDFVEVFDCGQLTFSFIAK